MDKYLLAILKEVNTIIIPGIGALTIVNQATGEVMFMSYMKFDDGKLAEYIAQKEGWELNDAKNLVSKYVRDINTKLDQGDSYDMYQFGSFIKNSEGEIEFNAWDGLSNVSTEQEIAKNPVNEVVTEEIEQKEEIEESHPIQEKLEEIQIEAEESTHELEAEVEEINEEKADHSIDGVLDLIEEVVTPHHEEKEISTDKVEDKVITPIASISEEEQWKDDLDVPPINLKKETPKKPILEKAKKDKIKKKRSVGFYVLMVFLVLLVGGGTYVGLNYNEFKEHIPFLASSQTEEPQEIEETNKEPDSETPVEEVESVKEEVTDETEPTKEDEVVEKTTPIAINSNTGLTVDQSLPIQIIVGSFTEESNAQRKITQLKESGVNAEIIGRYDGLHLVSVASFNSMSEVKTNTESIKSSAGTYWIFKK